jgi:hypothetical protein
MLAAKTALAFHYCMGISVVNAHLSLSTFARRLRSVSDVSSSSLLSFKVVLSSWRGWPIRVQLNPRENRKPAECICSIRLVVSAVDG